LAKRAQRSRERESGLVVVQLRLSAGLAKRLSFAARQRDFEAALSAFLDAETVDIASYPELKLLCWNRRSAFLSALEAWELYERNWRFVDRGRMESKERELIRMLAERFGGEILHV
jgi:hypothetical protein